MVQIEALGFGLDDLIRSIAKGEIRSQTHPDFPELSIFNYTEETQYRNLWNNITLSCRGLIVNTTTGEVVARPWEKFFNLGQRDNRIESTAPVEVTDKVDGSLGILYQRPDGVWAIATRGSFASEQALHATDLLHNKHGDDLFSKETGLCGTSVFSDYVRGITYLFEIVYPANRIVVDYGDVDDLVLLGGVDKERGHYYGPGVAAAAMIWRGPIVETFNYSTFVDAIGAPDRKGKEGYVIRSGSKIVKLKQADYVELHRIVTNMSPKTIWEQLATGKTIGDICKPLPDEFHDYVEKIGMKLLREASDLEYQIKVAYQHAFSTVAAKASNSMEVGISRRAYAEEFKKTKYASYLFSMLDGKPIDDAVWKAVKPSGDVKLVQENI